MTYDLCYIYTITILALNLDSQSDKGANKSLAVVAALCILSISRPDNCLVSKNVYYCHMKYDV